MGKDEFYSGLWCLFSLPQRASLVSLYVCQPTDMRLKWAHDLYFQLP
jgi:hypothetical protein